MGGTTEQAVQGSTTRSCQLHPFQRHCTSVLELLDHTEPAKNADGLGTHVLRACLVARKRGPVYGQHRVTGAGQKSGGSASGRPRARYQHIHLFGWGRHLWETQAEGSNR
jgi:hypothetical protein